jgi:molecular chaperone Hsp33
MTTPIKKNHTEKVRKFLSKDGFVRASSVIATHTINDMRSTLNSFPLASIAAGRALVGSILMASLQKEGHQVGLNFRGNGPLGHVFVESNFEGSVRAYVSNPEAELPLKNGKIDVAGGIGVGLLEVVRASTYHTQNHSGTVIIRTGEVGDDIAFYLEQSHQTPSVVALTCQVDDWGRVNCAGGVLIELMPGAPEDVISKIEKRAQEVTSLSQLIFEGRDEMYLAELFLKDFELLEMPHPFQLKYECKCSLERVTRSLLLVGYEEIDSLIAENKPTEIACGFCGKNFKVEIEELKKIREQSFRNSLN